MEQVETEPIGEETLEKYYQSLKASLREVETLEQTWLWHALGLVQKVILVAFGLSVAPVLPVVAWLLGARLPGSAPDLVVYWLGGALASGAIALLLAGGRSVLEKESPRVAVSPEQHLFIAVFEAYEALGAFAVARQVRDHHRAVRALRVFLLPTSSWALPAEWHSYMREHAPDRAFVDMRTIWQAPGAEVLWTWDSALYSTGRIPWLRLEPQSRRLLTALTAVPRRVLTRVADSTGLTEVRDLLSELAQFLYAYLPEHEATHSREELAQLRDRGDAASLRFADAVERLADYGPPPTGSATSRQPGWIASCAGTITGAITHRSALVRFGAWFGIIAVLVAAMLAAASAYVEIDPGAAALVFVSSTTLAPAALAVTRR